jgi:hypothetical protein
MPTTLVTFPGASFQPMDRAVIDARDFSQGFQGKVLAFPKLT